MTFQKVLELMYTDKEPTDIKNEILKLSDNKEEMNRAIALWACHYGFDDLKPQENEMVVPSDLEFYRNKKNMGDMVSLKTDFWTRPDIMSYVDNDSRIDSENRSNAEWLGKLITWLDEEQDRDYIMMIHDRIHEFERFFSVGKNMPYKKTNYVDKSGEIEKTRDIFNGTVV